MFEEEYPDLASIPAAVKHLYKEAGGKYILIPSTEMKTVGDIERVQEGARKEREDHKATKALLADYRGMGTTEELHEKLDKFDELETAAAGKLDDAAIDKIVESRIKSKTAPLQRQIETLTGERDTLKGSVSEFETKETKRVIHDHIRKAATTALVQGSAIDDALLLGENVFTVDADGRVVTKDNVGVTPGIDPSVWFTELKSTRAHWWPESQGVGAKGSGAGGGGVNPFSADGWNMTEQGKLVIADRSKAEQMAKSAGTTIGGAKPAKK